MGMMNAKQSRLINPVLTRVARGYKHPKSVGHLLFPDVPVPFRGGQIVQFGKESFKRYKTRLAEGGTRKSVTFGYDGDPYKLHKHALDAQVTEAQLEESAAAGVDIEVIAVQGVQDIIALDLEIEKAAIARNESNYETSHKTTLSGTSQWSDPTSTPKTQIKAARAAIRAATGFYPNVAILGAQVFEALDEHPAIMERTKYTSSDSVTEEMLAKLWQIEQVASAPAVYVDENGDFVDVWGKDVILAYVNLSTLKDRGSPSYGYNYQLQGRPVVKKSYFDPKTDSHMHPYEDICAAVLAAPGAGYLIRNAVA